MRSLLKPEIHLRNGFKDKKRLARIHEIPCQVCYHKSLTQATRTIAHHKIGNGLGLKASDLLTMGICEDHHNKGKDGIHNMPLWEWEEKFFTQEELIEMTNKALSEL